MQPADFWALTPAEFGEMIEGASDRKAEEWERAAWQTAHIVNLWAKQRVTPERLLGPGWQRRKRGAHKVIDPEAKFNELWRRHEEKIGG